MEAITEVPDITPQTNREDVIKVTAKAEPRPLARTIARALAEGPSCTVRAIGASAVNQSVKALSIARGDVAMRGQDLVVRPGMETTTDVTRPGTSGSKELSCVVFRVSVV